MLMQDTRRLSFLAVWPENASVSNFELFSVPL